MVRDSPLSVDDPAMLLRSTALALFAATSACSGSGNHAHDDPSQPIEARAGSDVTLALKSNQSTGYQWVLVDSAALGPLSLADMSYEVPRRYRDHSGAGGTERWTFRAPTAGQGIVSLVYVRPWEKEVPKDTTRFRVTVR
jgi:predicted secreted protein